MRGCMFLRTIKHIDLCDLPVLVIAYEDSDLIRIPGLQCQQLSEGVEASVNKVTVISVCVCVCVSVCVCVCVCHTLILYGTLINATEILYHKYNSFEDI